MIDSGLARRISERRSRILVRMLQRSKGREEALEQRLEDILKARVARLREALERVICKCQADWCGEETPCNSCAIARAALKENKK